VDIPEGITTIMSGAFEKCSNLETVTIPASVDRIDNRPFDSCTSLVSITVDENNKNYTSVDGVLLGWFGGDLIQYPAGREEEYTVPESVIRVSDHAFRMAKTKSIRFTGEAPEMGDYVFESVFAEVRYPYGSEAWAAVTSQNYGGASIKWIACNPITGKDLVDRRLADLTDLDFMAFSQLAYRDFTNAELNRPLDELVGDWRTNVWSNRDITYTELIENIGEWMPVDTFASDIDGYYAVLFANGFGEAVLAYRGSIAITKLFDMFTADQWDAIMDWLVNDFPMEVFDILSPQVYLALDTFDAVAANYPLDQLVTTGHSLGGTLANITAAYSGVRSESVNAISSLDTVYSYEPGYMGENFTGVENWDIEDHANRNDILAGVYEAWFTTRLKPYTQHESLYGELSLGSNHSVYSMIDRNESGKLTVTETSGGFRPEKPISTSLLSSLSMLKLGTANDEKLTCYVTGALYNSLYGGSGNDRLVGGLLNDTLIGGPGNDHLDGGYGDDTYHYYEGHGSDTIYDVSGADTLCLYGYAPKYVTIDSDDDFVKLYDNDRLIVKIDKNSRSAKSSDFTLKFYQRGYHPANKYETVNIGKYFTANFTERVAVGCPVDIDIVDGQGNVVYTVRDGEEGEYYTEYGNFYVYMEENGEYGKILDLKEGYTIRIIGLDKGTMEVTHWSVDGDELTDNGTAENIPVREGSENIFDVDRLGYRCLVDNDGAMRPLQQEAADEEPRDMEYTLHSVLLYNEDGVMDEVPDGLFNASVALENHASTHTDTVMLALYSADGQLLDLMGQSLQVQPGGTARPIFTLDNSDGRIAMIRAFVVSKAGGMVPLGNVMTAGSIS
ncbi:MAG: leucine-rich repeat protein, partial [Clostridia bacterium]|nr:leucine-rich repeat protein [Clostridia bacterium]